MGQRPLPPRVHEALPSPVQLTRSMDSLPFIKALKTPPEPTGWRARYWDLRFHITCILWPRYAPRWLDHWLRDLSAFYWKHVRSRIAPQNRWATRAVARTWQDIDTVVENVLFAAIVHYVEEERCFKTIVIEEPTASKIREIYAWAKGGREAAQKAASALWEPGLLTPSRAMSGKTAMFSQSTGDFQAYCAATDAVTARDTEYLTWLVQNRETLWT
jgi:hypothetical protein